MRGLHGRAEALPVRVAVGGMGAAMVAAALSGRADLYVRGYFVPVLGVAGVALLALAATLPLRASRSAAMLLALPVVAGLGIGPAQAASLPAAPAGGQVGARLGDGSNPLVAGGAGPVTVLQIQLAAQEEGPAALIGRRVTVEAEVASPTSIERLAMVCCAADARPVVLDVTGRPMPKRGTWVTVTGTLTVNAGQAALVADTVRTVPVPASPIL